MMGKHNYSVRYKIQLAKLAIEHRSKGGAYSDVAAFADISGNLLWSWVKNYKIKTWINKPDRNVPYIQALTIQELKELKSKLKKYEKCG